MTGLFVCVKERKQVNPEFDGLVEFKVGGLLWGRVLVMVWAEKAGPAAKMPVGQEEALWTRGQAWP